MSVKMTFTPSVQYFGSTFLSSQQGVIRLELRGDGMMACTLGNYEAMILDQKPPHYFLRHFILIHGVFSWSTMHHVRTGTGLGGTI